MSSVETEKSHLKRASKHIRCVINDHHPLIGSHNLRPTFRRCTEIIVIVWFSHVTLTVYPAGAMMTSRPA